MTFVLKELAQLREDFNDTVDIMMKRGKGKIGKIEDLPEPRKSELQYLSSILDKVEEQVNQKEKPLKSLIGRTIYYGAMLAIRKDIENNRGTFESSGLLSERLANTIGIHAEAKEEDKPDLYQMAKFYTAINGFLNQVFIDNDSRKGLKKNHILHAIPTDHLNELLKISYQLEKDAEKAIVTSLAADGKTKVVFEKNPSLDGDAKTVFVGGYTAGRKSPASATERFGSLAKLNEDLEDLIKEELADKNVAKIDKLGVHRAAKLHFLKTISAAVKNAGIDESEKTAILAGAMHLVRQQIDGEYDSSYVPSVVSKKENSIIHTGLNKILGKKDEIDPEDVEALITSTTQFIRFLTIEPKNNGKKTMRSNHAFSAIAGFELKPTFNLLIDMIHACRNDALHHVVEEFKKEGKAPEKPSKSYIASALSKLSFLSKKDDHSDEEVDELEHNNYKH